MVFSGEFMAIALDIWGALKDAIQAIEAAGGLPLKLSTSDSVRLYLYAPFGNHQTGPNFVLAGSVHRLDGEQVGSAVERAIEIRIDELPGRVKVTGHAHEEWGRGLVAHLGTVVRSKWHEYSQQPAGSPHPAFASLHPALRERRQEVLKYKLDKWTNPEIAKAVKESVDVVKKDVSWLRRHEVLP